MQVLMLAVFFMAFLLSAEAYGQTDMEVLRVVDGCSFVGKTESKVVTIRLLGAVAPDKSLKQPGYLEAKASLEELIGGKTLQVQTRRIGDTLYGIVAVDGKSINLAMIQSGWAWYQPNHVESAQLAKAQQEANSRKRGIWAADEEPAAPWEYKEHLARLAEERKRTEREMLAKIAEESRAKTQPIIDRAVVYYGGAKNLEKLNRASAQIEADFVIFALDFHATWDLPGRFKLSISSNNKSAKKPDDQKVEFILNGAKGWTISSGKTRELTPDEIKMAKYVLEHAGDVLILNRTLTSDRFLVVPHEGGDRAEDLLTFIPRDEHLPDGNAPVTFVLRFDKKKGRLIGAEITAPGHGGQISLLFDEEKMFGDLRYWTKIRPSNPEERYSIHLKKLELLDRIDPSLFSEP